MPTGLHGIVRIKGPLCIGTGEWQAGWKGARMSATYSQRAAWRGILAYLIPICTTVCAWTFETIIVSQNRAKPIIWARKDLCILREIEKILVSGRGYRVLNEQFSVRYKNGGYSKKKMTGVTDLHRCLLYSPDYKRATLILFPSYRI